MHLLASLRRHICNRSVQICRSNFNVGIMESGVESPQTLRHHRTCSSGQQIIRQPIVKGRRGLIVPAQSLPPKHGQAERGIRGLVSVKGMQERQHALVESPRPLPSLRRRLGAGRTHADGRRGIFRRQYRGIVLTSVSTAAPDLVGTLQLPHNLTGLGRITTGAAAAVAAC